MSTLGNLFLILAVAAALGGSAAFFLCLRQKNDRLFSLARHAARAVFWLLSLAVATLLAAFLSHNFGLKYVYENSSRDTPAVFLLSALWRGNGGALLFWGWIIALAGMVLLGQSKKIGRELLPPAMAILLLTAALFVTLIFVDNPFKTTAEAATDGIGLNPLLQNPGMLFHPPALLAGWALMAVPFALAMAALITRRLGSDWLVPARRWALAAWILLGAGNLLGAWWAYSILNWGGYWAWDPVENAGLMPWLLVTAFLHATMMQRRRGLFKTWNLLLIILAFGLTIFGAMVTRTDLSAVHGFGSSIMGPILLVFLVAVLAASLGLVAARRRDLKDEAGDAAVISGESTFLLNNLLLAAATLTIFLGTVFPFLSRFFSGSSVEMTPSFFNTVGVPLFLTIILLAGICVFVGWRVPAPGRLGRELLTPAVTALVAVLAVFLLGRHQWYALAGIFILAFVLAATLSRLWRDIAGRCRTGKENPMQAGWFLFKHNRSRYGGYVIHLAIAIIAVGVLGSSVYEAGTQPTALNPGESVSIGGYTLTMQGVTPTPGTVKMEFTADVTVSRNDRVVAELYPQDIYYANYGWAPHTAIRSSLSQDIWVSVITHDEATGEPLATPLLTVLVKPLVSWIWVGGIILLLGGLWAYGAPPRKEPVD